MTDHKPRPLWPLVTAALIGLPVLYVASFGPACWIASHTDTDESIFFQYGYWPLGRICLEDSVGSSFLSAYAAACLPEDALLAIPAQYGEVRMHAIEGPPSGRIPY